MAAPYVPEGSGYLEPAAMLDLKRRPWKATNKMTVAVNTKDVGRYYVLKIEEARPVNLENMYPECRGFRPLGDPKVRIQG